MPDASPGRAAPWAGRVVMVAYYFPPLVGIASERAASLSRHLRALGWEPVVVTARSGFYHRTRSDGDDHQFPVIRTPSLELSRVLRKLHAQATGSKLEMEPTTVRGIETGGLGEAARRVVRDFVYVPDAQIGWIPYAAAAARRALDGHAPGVIFSTSVPFSAHIAAMRARARADVGWVAEFRDPWTGSTSPDRSTNALRRRVDRRLERRIVLSADHVVVTAESTRIELLELHPGLAEDRISVITNGFEPLPEREPPGNDEPMTIVYAGTVAPGEDTAAVLSAFDLIQARRPGAFRLRVFGPPEPWQSADPNVDRPWLELRGIVSPALAREGVARASALLLFQRHPAYRGIVPGKVFEYIGARRPILAVVPAGSEMATLITNHADARLVDPHDLGGLAIAAEQLLTEHRAGSLKSPRVATSLTDSLRRIEQAKKLAAIFARVAR